MNVKLNTFFLVIFLTVLLRCSPEKKDLIQQQKNYWIELNSGQATSVDGILQWNFKLDKRGKYDVQILCNSGQADFSEVDLECAGIKFSQAPTKINTIFVEDQKLSVFQFAKTIVFSETGLQTLKLRSGKPFEKIRIIPHYRQNLGFGSGKYFDQWQKMHNSSQKQVALAWLKEAKFGMFIHWGLYSQAGGIWKGVKMEDSGIPGPGVSEWLMYKFQIPRNEYAELAKTFNPDKSFAQNIAKLARDAGMKYVVITSKHHDGFALFNSKCSEFDMVDATPYKADAVKELYDACLAEGLGFGVYYSHGNDWHDGSDGNYKQVKQRNDSLGILTHASGKNLWDPSPNTHAGYIAKKALPQIKELLQSLPKLRLIWFDGDGFITEDQSFQFYKTIFDINPNVIVNRRVGYDFGDYLDAGDNVIPSADEAMEKYWETCGTTNNSWAYKSYDHDFKSTRELLYYLVDIASKGGNYLLNIGPDGVGHVPEESARCLREMGAWLAKNGEAVYGTSRWKIPYEGQAETALDGTGKRAKNGFSRTFSANDFWFTQKGTQLYAIALFSPNSEITIKSLASDAGRIQAVSLLGSDINLHWVQTKKGLTVDMTDIGQQKNGYVLKIQLEK